MIIGIDKLTFEDMKNHYMVAYEYMMDYSVNNKLSFDQLLFMKDLYSSQKFSHYLQKEMARILGHSEEPMYSIFDARDQTGSKEYKYATYSYNRGASFPQIIRLDHQPDTYVIAIFYGSELRVYEVPGKEMHNSIIRHKATLAHANNDNELRINIKIKSKEMAFLESHFNPSLTEKLMKATYGAIQ